MIELRVFGQLSVIRDGCPVHLRSKKEYALLVYLALQPDRKFQRSHLARLFWPDSPPKRAHHSLSQALYNLNQLLPELSLERRPREVWVPSGSLQVDALEFQELVDRGELHTASRIYEADLGECFSANASAEFEHWLEALRVKLRNQAHQALQDLLKEAFDREDWDQAEKIGERIRRLDPFDEDAHRYRILAIAANGDRARALREHEEVCAFVRREIGRDPAEPLNTLNQRITTEFPVVDHVDGVPEEPDQPLPFVGREGEFRKIRVLWDRVRGGRGQSVMVVGAPGVGKTRFSWRFLRLAVIQGARILTGRCYPCENRLPYSGVIDALSNGLSVEDLSGLSPAWSAVVSELLPELASPDSSSPARSTLEGEGAQRRLFEGIARVLHNVSRHNPVVLFIDDFHWADNSTSALVHYLARRLVDAPVMVVLALRGEDVVPDSSVTLLLRDGQKGRLFERVQLNDFSEEASTELVRHFERQHRLELHAALREQIVRRAGGRPFFLIEILRALTHRTRVESPFPTPVPGGARAVPLPGSIEEFLTARLTGLSEEAVWVMSALAVLGKESGPELVQTVSRLPSDAFVEASEQLCRRGVVSETGSNISFVHDLVREVVYRQLGNLRRRLLHERAADALRNADNVAAGTLAVHYDVAGNAAQAYRYALHAAEASERVHAHSETEFFLRMALTNARDDAQRLEVRERLATLLFQTRRFREAERHFAEIERQYERSGNTAGLLDVRLNRTSILVKLGTVATDYVLSRLQSLAETARAAGDRSQHARTLALLVEVAHEAGEKSIVLSSTRQLIDVWRSDPRSRQAVEALRMIANMMGLYVNLDDAKNYADTAVVAAEEIDDVVCKIISLSSRAMNQLQAGMLHAAEQDFIRALELADENAIVAHDHCLTNNYGVCLLEKGEYDQSIEAFKRALRVADQASARHEFQIIYQNLALVELERSSLEAARAYARKILRAEDTGSAWWSSIVAWTVLGYNALRDQDYTEANQLRRKILDKFSDRNYWVCDFSYTEIFLARLAEAEGERTKALERLEEVIAAYEGRDVLCRSRLMLERARLLIEKDATRAARAAREVRERAVEMGAAPLVEKADRILDRAGTPANT